MGFAERLRNAAQKRKVCSCCGGQYPSFWFYSLLRTESKPVKVTFFKGKWYTAQMPICKICKISNSKVDHEARRTVYGVRGNGEARDDREARADRQAA